MGFDEHDTTESKEITTRPMGWRVERNDGYPEGEPPVDIYVVMEIDGHAQHFKVPRETVIASWDDPEKTLKEWTFAAINAVS